MLRLRTTIVYSYRNIWDVAHARRTHRKPLVEFYYLSKILLHYDDERLIMRMSATFPYSVKKERLLSHNTERCFLLCQLPQSVYRDGGHNNDERNLWLILYETRLEFYFYL